MFWSWPRMDDGDKFTQCPAGKTAVPASVTEVVDLVAH